MFVLGSNTFQMTGIAIRIFVDFERFLALFERILSSSAKRNNYGLESLYLMLSKLNYDIYQEYLCRCSLESQNLHFLICGNIHLLKEQLPRPPYFVRLFPYHALRVSRLIVGRISSMISVFDGKLFLKMNSPFSSPTIGMGA